MNPQNSDCNVILIHGKDTDPSQGRYPWLKEVMEEYDIPYIAPQLPDSEDPEIKAWMSNLERLCPDEDSILIGHSRGGVAILRWLEQQDPDVTVKKIILIATNSGSTANRTKSEKDNGFFTDEGYDYEKLKRHCNDYVVMHSKDDEWVPYTDGVAISQGLKCELLTFYDRGHFGRGLAKLEIPELLKEIRKVL